MEWEPKSDEDMDKELLLPAGIYPAEILEIEEKDDKKGRPFLSLKLGVASDDREQHVYDNISPSWFAWKFKHFFYSLGKPEWYEKGKLPVSDLSDLLHLPLTVEVGIEDAKGEYKAKNVVLDYVQAEVAAAIKKAPEVQAAAAADDDLPF